MFWENSRPALPDRPRMHIEPGIICLTEAAKSALHAGHRPAAPTVFCQPGQAQQVRHLKRTPAGCYRHKRIRTGRIRPAHRKRVLPALASRKNTRSSAQVWRTATNTNSRPDHGWNG